MTSPPDTRRESTQAHDGNGSANSYAAAILSAIRDGDSSTVDAILAQFVEAPDAAVVVAPPETVPEAAPETTAVMVAPPETVPEAAPETTAEEVLEAPAVAEVPPPAPARISLWLPGLSLVSACGLALIVAAFALGRSGHGQPDYLFWLGLLAIVVPISYRLLSARAPRIERVGLVLLAGLQLYLVKIAYAPWGFTFADEFIHWFNADAITAKHSLFTESPLLPVASRYPGLEIVTNAFSSMSGLSTFAAGVIVIGVARSIMMLALYFFFEEVSGSSRIAGLAALLYGVNQNFLYFDAQFKYESLALPLAFVALLAVAKWQKPRPRHERHMWLTVAGLAIFGTIVTHHLTSYALVIYLAAVSLVHFRLKKPRASSPLRFAVFAAAATVAWLFFVAGETRGYLYGIVSHAVTGFVETVTSQHTRTLFKSSSAISSPFWEHVVGIAAVAVMLVALPVALRRVRLTYRRDVHVVVLSAAAIAAVASFALRLSPAAWEIANRAGEFLFLGMGLVLGLAALELMRARFLTRGRIAIFGCAVAVLFMGGHIAGWPWDLRLPGPIRVASHGHTIQAQGYELADWARSALGPGGGIIADESNRRLLAEKGATFTYGSSAYAVDWLIERTELNPTSFWFLKRVYPMIRYIVIDRRWDAGDNMRGFYFLPQSDKNRRPLDMSLKYEHLQGVQRLADTGDIVVYDVGRAPRYAPQP